MPIIKLMDADAIKLALQYYGDATNFVQILQENHLDDWRINAPVFAKTLVSNLAGDTVLVLVPTEDIEAGMLVYCAGLDTHSFVVKVENIFEVPKGLSFFSFNDFQDCPNTGPVPQRVLPAQGKWISTNVTIAPVLDTFMVIASEVTFAVGAPTPISIPTPPSSKRGAPA